MSVNANNTTGLTRAELESIVESAMVDWEARYLALSESDRYDVDAHLAAMAERYARASAYIARRRQGGKHADAVTRQNQVADKVRRALGYTYPNTITF